LRRGKALYIGKWKAGTGEQIIISIILKENTISKETYSYSPFAFSCFHVMSVQSSCQSLALWTAHHCFAYALFFYIIDFTMNCILS
jgi:hypothetical protein